jgi:hypothetical protein
MNCHVVTWLDSAGNDQCADCSQPNPEWASYNLGIFLCTRCAACHRYVVFSYIFSCVVDPDPDLDWIWTQEDINTHKNLKKLIISFFEVLGVLFLRAEGFSCVLDVLYGGLGINKLHFLIKKR